VTSSPTSAERRTKLSDPSPLRERFGTRIDSPCGRDRQAGSLIALKLAPRKNP